MRLIILGCGGVGRQLIQHIISCRDLHSKMGVHLKVVGVCDSKSLVVSSDLLTKDFDDNLLSALCQLKSSGLPMSDFTIPGEFQIFTNSEVSREITAAISLLGKSDECVLVVDCTASSGTIDVLKQAVDFGCCIVLANKKPLTSSLEDFDKLASDPRRLRHESTVGAGLPVITSLNRMISSGDGIHRIVGSLSGTLGYVMSELEDGKPLSEVVKAAKSLGYTEPDPRDDLGGMDVARKALILARLMGQRISLDSIKIESLYPEQMAPDVMSVEDFLCSGLILLDKNIEERVKKASSNGNVLRYVCVIEEKRCNVGIQEVPSNSPLGRLRGSDNILEVYSRCYNEQPLVIQGAGAGNDTTAAGVLADILDLQD